MEQRKLQNQVQFFSGLTYSPNDVKDVGTFVIRSSNIKDNTLVSADNVYVNPNIANSEPVKKDDVIMVVRNGSKSLIGKHALVTRKIDNTVIGAFMTGIRSSTPYFLDALLDTLNFKKEIYKNLGATINQITIGNLRKMTFKVPNESEKFKIGNLFKKLNYLLALYEMKKQLLTQLKQGIVNFLITKNGQKPQLRFIGFNNNWESKSFEKLLNYEQPTKYIVKKADYISQGTPVLTANKSFILGYTNETNVYQSIPAIIFDDFTLESKYVDFPFMVKSSAIKILTSKNSNLFFIYQLLNNQKFVQEGHSRHYISVVQKKKVLVPSIQEQNKIGNLIKQLENSIEQNSNTITLLKRLKEFLLQNMFL